MRGVPRMYDGTPGQGMPRFNGGASAQGGPRFAEGTQAHGVPRFTGGTPAHGFPRLPDGTPAHGMPRFPDGTPAHGVTRFPDGTPAHGFPRLPDGTPARGFPESRGGHPEQREGGGGWGPLGGDGRTAGAGQGMTHGAPSGALYGAPPGPSPGALNGAPGGRRSARVPIPRQRREASPAGGPLQAYLDAFDEVDDALAPDPAHRVTPGADTDVQAETALQEKAPPEDPSEGKETAKGGKGKAFTGIAAAAVTTVLAVIVGGQFVGGQNGTATQPQAAGGGDRDVRDTSRSDRRPEPSSAPRASVAALSYDEKMGKKYTLAADLEGSGKFQAVMGFDKAPGTGQKYRYRVDVEEGLGLDAALFAEAVQKTLNDERSWAHGGGRTFERISSGRPDFVITLASPGTTAVWCAKSGLDTTVDNVSCNSSATERVMINAYRWAQGAETYGDQIHAYRQMLINHEIGHRLGYEHETCDKDGELAPVMQQQSKFLTYGGITCKANPWPYPGS